MKQQSLICKQNITYIRRIEWDELHLRCYDRHCTSWFGWSLRNYFVRVEHGYVQFVAILIHQWNRKYPLFRSTSVHTCLSGNHVVQSSVSGVVVYRLLFVFSCFVVEPLLPTSCVNMSGYLVTTNNFIDHPLSYKVPVWISNLRTIIVGQDLTEKITKLYKLIT